jgi:tetratricopeptide (TPR) repeat protein
MSIFGKWLAPWYSGLAFNKFARKEYEEAARFFEKTLKLDSTGDGLEFVYSCLGRCHLALGNQDGALDNLSKSYALFQKRAKAIEDDLEKRQFKESLKAYSLALQKSGDAGRAKEIAQEADGIM